MDENAEMIVLEWEDIHYLAVVQFGELVEGDPVSLSFSVYRIEGWDDDGPFYRPKNYLGIGNKTIRDRSLAQRFAEGRVKWDGCCDIRFQPDATGAYEHWCSREQARAWGTVVDRLYDALSERRSHNVDLK